MVYNNGYPATYQQPTYQMQAQPTYQMQAQPTQSGQRMNNSFAWVQGEAAAMAYPIEPNTRLMMLDTNGKTFYIKASDATGYPSPLEIYDYHRRDQASDVFVPQPMNSYDMPDNMATKDDIQRIYDELSSVKQMIEQNNGGMNNDSKQHGELLQAKS